MSEPDYTTEWLKSEVRKHYRTYLPLRRCSICKGVIGYHILKGGIYFDPSCFCNHHFDPPEPRDWDDVLACITRQETPEIRRQVADTLLGLRKPE